MFKNFKVENKPRADFSDELIQIPNSDNGYLRGQKENPAFLEGKGWQDHEPTPDNPAPIQSIPHDTGIVSCGENLIDIGDNFSNTNVGITFSWDNAAKVYTINGTSTGGNASNIANLPYLYLQNGEQYRFTMFYIGGIATSFGEAFYPRIQYQRTDGGWSNLTALSLYVSNYNNPIHSIRFTGNGRPLRFTPVLGGSVTNLKYYISITKGDNVPDKYTPYQGSTTHLSLIGAPNAGEWAGQEIELMGLPDGTADYYNQDKKVVGRKCGERTANGSENGWFLYLTDNMSDYIRFINDELVADRIPAEGDSYGVSGRFISDRFMPGAAWTDSDNSDQFSFSNTSQRLYIKIAKSNLIGYSPELTSAQKVQLFRNWLSANPVTIQYVCEPYEIPVITQPKIITVDDTIGTVYNLDGAKMNVNAISYGEEL